LVKAINLDSYPEGAVQLRTMLAKLPNTVLLDQPLDRATTLSLYGQADAVLSLHRSEGFGLVLAEGMLAGRPVISTDWSGPTDFLNKQNGLPVRYDLVAASDPQGFYEHPSMTWAEPDVDDAAGKLNSLLDRSLRTQIGVRAQRDASEQFSAAAYVRRVAGLLELPSTC
jgi:glycosyltransferase involved in cell wall biosynthesis